MVNGSCPSDKKTPSQPSSSSTVPTTQTPTDSSSEVDDDSIDNKLPDLGTGTFKRPTLLHSGVREFYIRAGIGSQSWNTRDETIEMQVGQTLRVINQDAIAHSLFLPGLDGRSIVIEPGKSHDYTLDSPIEPGTNPPTYDQSTGENAKFWLRVRP